jgi:hypothetical protein
VAIIIFDSQFDESSGVLRNVFGLPDAEKLEQKIANYSAARVLQLLKAPLQGRFDIQHLRRIHQHIFQDISRGPATFEKSPLRAPTRSDFRRRSFSSPRWKLFSPR